jgi:hypothetical protein
VRLAGALALALAAGAAGAAAKAQETTGGPVEREWRTRRRALDLATARPELEGALAARDWSRRRDALDAVARGLRVGAQLPPELRAPVERGLTDEHAGVRAAALALLRELGADADLAPDRARTLARDLLPAVRLAAARALETVPCAAAAEILAELCADADARVARAARRALLLLPASDAARAAKLALLARTLAARDEAGLVECARWIDASEPAPRLLEEARALLEPADEDARRAWRSVLEAIAIARTGRGSVERLMAGWSAALEGEAGRDRRALLLGAARSQREDVALAWLERLETEPSWELARAVLDCVGPERALALQARSGTGPEAWAVLVSEVGSALPSWSTAPPEAEVTTWLAPGRPVPQRHAAAGAFARTRARTGDRTAGELLVAALDDADAELREEAFLALATADDIAPFVGALAGAWRGWDAGARARAAEDLPRGVPLPAFRDDLIAQGRRGGDERRVAVELLAGLAGDAELRALVAEWLAEDLARFEDGTPARALELALQGELRGLAAIDAEGSVDELEDALVRSLGRSEEVGKVAAASLGRTERGRDRLQRHLGTGVDARTRMEAEIQLAAAGRAAAVEPLIADFDDAAWDLAVRMLRALGRVGDERSSAFLLAVARDEARDVVLRIAAVEALGRRGEVGNLAPVLDARDVEVVYVALRALGAVGDEAATRTLLTYLEGLNGGERLPVELALLRGEVLAALGRVVPPPPRAEEEWLRSPLEAARGDLFERFESRRPGAPGFRYAGELELAAGLAAAGRVSGVLAGGVPWWRLDGELLVALGERAQREAEAGRALLEGAVVALDGFEDRELARHRARARFLLAGRLWRLERWDAYARVAAGLARDLRTGALPRAAWREALGVPDLGAGVDPGARLAASVWQARARAALGAGDRESAQSLAEEAGRRVGRSDRARMEQERLLSALDAR